MPIIDLQRRFAEVGRIRAGAKNDKGHAMRLDSWRLTSANRAALEAAADLYGGNVVEWNGSPTGRQFELFTKSDALDVLVPPGVQASLWYEHWSGGGCERRCDGQHDHLNDTACICDHDNRECKPTMRVSLCLHLLPGIGVWRYESHGYYAATELPQTIEFLAEAANRGQYLTGKLRLEERMSKTKKNGTRKFLVPVLDLDYSVGQMAGLSPVETKPAIAAPIPAAPALESAPVVASIAASDADKKKIWAAAKKAGMTVEDLDLIISGLRNVTATIGDVHKDEIDEIMSIISNEGATS